MPAFLHGSGAYNNAIRTCFELKKLMGSRQFQQVMNELHVCPKLEKMFASRIQNIIWDALTRSHTIKQVTQNLKNVKRDWKAVLAAREFAKQVTKLRLNQTATLKDKRGRNIKIIKLHGQLRVDCTKELSVLLKRFNLPPNYLFGCKSWIRYPKALNMVLVNGVIADEDVAYQKLAEYDRPDAETVKDYQQLFKNHILENRLQKLGKSLFKRTLPNGLAVVIKRRNKELIIKTSIGLIFTISGERDGALDRLIYILQWINPEENIRDFLGSRFNLVFANKSLAKSEKTLKMVHECLLNNHSPNIYALLNSQPQNETQDVPATC